MSGNEPDVTRQENHQYERGTSKPVPSWSEEKLSGYGIETVARWAEAVWEALTFVRPPNQAANGRNLGQSLWMKRRIHPKERRIGSVEFQLVVPGKVQHLDRCQFAVSKQHADVALVGAGHPDGNADLLHLFKWPLVNAVHSVHLVELPFQSG